MNVHGGGVMGHRRGSENNSRQSVLSFHHESSKDQAHAMGLGGKYLCLLSSRIVQSMSTLWKIALCPLTLLRIRRLTRCLPLGSAHW